MDLLIMVLCLSIVPLCFGYYVNKTYKKKGGEQEIIDLYDELKKALINEDHKKASIVRDKLRKITKCDDR